MNAHQIVEAVLFASYAPLTADEIARADEMLDEEGEMDDDDGDEEEAMPELEESADGGEGSKMEEVD